MGRTRAPIPGIHHKAVWIGKGEGSCAVKMAGWKLQRERAS